MCLNIDIHQDDNEELDKLLIELYQKYKSYAELEQKISKKQLIKNFIEDIKFKLDTLNLNSKIEERVEISTILNTK